MRLLLILFTVLALIITAGLWIGQTIENDADQFSKHIDGIKDNITQGNWDLANAKIMELEEKWSQKVNGGPL
ncbi:hypothetical protein N752_10910 [Desulforamulus aquiferis]|nr:hypothetical protein N752_10910 [Desulforamulus aquiferis]